MAGCSIYCPEVFASTACKTRLFFDKLFPPGSFNKERVPFGHGNILPCEHLVTFIVAYFKLTSVPEIRRLQRKYFRIAGCCFRRMECNVLWDREVLAMFMKSLVCVKMHLVIHLFNTSITKNSNDNSWGGIQLVSRVH